MENLSMQFMFLFVWSKLHLFILPAGGFVLSWLEAHAIRELQQTSRMAQKFHVCT